MNKIISVMVLAILPMTAWGAGNIHLEEANVDVSDKASLQRGARLFVNYCLSCHSAAYQRYNRMGRDIGLTDEQVADNLMFASDKVGDTMTIAMSEDDSRRWFGNPPPDLSVIARARGADWLYTYFTTFYIDEKRPFGVNNAVFPDVGMPHVLWELEGLKKARFEERDGTRIIKGYEIVVPGTMSEAEYREAARDLTNFLVYTGEPIQLERKALGVKVLIFLVIFTLLAYALKREYWKDVH